jgi:hypothetical protein
MCELRMCRCANSIADYADEKEGLARINSKKYKKIVPRNR